MCSHRRELANLWRKSSAATEIAEPLQGGRLPGIPVLPAPYFGAGSSNGLLTAGVFV